MSISKCLEYISYCLTPHTVKLLHSAAQWSLPTNLWQPWGLQTNAHWLRKWRKQARVSSVYARTLIPLDDVPKGVYHCQTVWFFKNFLKINFLTNYLEETFSCYCYYSLTDNDWWWLCPLNPTNKNVFNMRTTPSILYWASSANCMCQPSQTWWTFCRRKWRKKLNLNLWSWFLIVPPMSKHFNHEHKKHSRSEHASA